MKIGYIRVSTSKQHTERQYMALEPLSLDRVYAEKRSGKTTDRPELAAMLAALREGDTVYIESLSRLGRNMQDLLDLVAAIGDTGAALVSVKERLDFTSAQGRLLFHVSAAFAQFERDIIAERTCEGLAAAREQGHKGGRPATDARAIAQARKLVGAGMSVSDACRAASVARSVYYRAQRG